MSSIVSGFRKFFYHSFEHLRRLQSLYKRVADETGKTNEVFLVLRCQAGDREAFDELLRSIQTRLSRYIANLTRGSDLTDDILQEVFLIIYRKIGWLNDPQLFHPWVYRIATREAVRALKKRSKWREEKLDETVTECVAAPAAKTELDISMLDRVSHASRAVLALHYLEEFSLVETADVLDISVGTVKSRLAYGLKQLRGQVNDQKEK